MEISPVKRIEKEERITKKDYLMLLRNKDESKCEIQKTRYCLAWNNSYFEIDVYPFAKNTAICEIELAEEDEKFVLPEFLEVMREVTNENEFKNASIALKIPAELN